MCVICDHNKEKKEKKKREREHMGVRLELKVRQECLVVRNEIYMCGYLTCPLCDDRSGYMVRMCAVLLNYKRQLLAVLPQFNFSLLQGSSVTEQLTKSLLQGPL